MKPPLRLRPMLVGMGLVVAVLTAGALASASPHRPDTLDCGGGAVQVIQADGVLLPGPDTTPASPDEATAAAHQTAAAFVGQVVPGLPIDQVVDASPGAAGTTLPPAGRPDGPVETPDLTVATKADGQVTAVVTLNHDATGRRWAVDRTTLCASTAAAAARSAAQAPASTSTSTSTTITTTAAPPPVPAPAGSQAPAGANPPPVSADPAVSAPPGAGR